MLSKSEFERASSGPVVKVAIAVSVVLTLASTACWYLFTDHSLGETLALVSAVGLATGIGLLRLRALRALNPRVRRSHQPWFGLG